MLQIMSGKFFQGDDRYTSPGKGILFSNFSWVRPIVTCVGTLEPVDSFAAVSGFVFSYTNQMEKRGEPRAGDLGPTGDREIVSQFALLSMFALNAWFDADRANVVFNCRPNAIASHESYIPSHFVDGIFAPRRRGTVEDEAALARFVAKAIAMPRAHYKALTDVLDALSRAYQAINGSLDLAYSMVVYCLESLAQKFDRYEPIWSDYEEGPRKRFDAALKEAPPEAGARVRALILDGAHLKLRARLIHFVQAHLSPEYFTQRAINRKWPIKKGQLERALTNAYVMRSGYVHQLRSIQEQLHQSFIAEGEVFEWEREPYLTLRGLVNLATDVVKNFVEKAPEVEKETVNWRGDLPGITRLTMAPQYWIWKHEALNELRRDQRIADVKARYHGLLQLVLEIALKPGSPFVDLRALVAFYEQLVQRCTKDERPAIMATYVLFNSLVSPAERAPNFDRLAPSFANELATRSIEAMALEVMLEDDVRGELAPCVEAYEAYSSKRFSAMTLELPTLVEVKVLAAIANKALLSGLVEEHARILDIAIGEAAGHETVQRLLAESKAAMAAVELAAIFTLPRKQDGTAHEEGSGTAGVAEPMETAPRAQEASPASEPSKHANVASSEGDGTQ